MTEKDYKADIVAGAKAATEIGKSRDRTFLIGFGLLGLRAEVLKAMGKDPLVNDRSILKAAKYRELMSAALKKHKAYTLPEVFKNDSTRLAYVWCAENRDEILRVFAEAEVTEPGSTIRIVNPERIKSKFKTLTEPLKESKAAKAANNEAAAQEAEREAHAYRDEWKEKYEALKVEYDKLWDDYQGVTKPKTAKARKAKAPKVEPMQGDAIGVEA